MDALNRHYRTLGVLSLGTLAGAVILFLFGEVFDRVQELPDQAAMDMAWDVGIGVGTPILLLVVLAGSFLWPKRV